MNKFQKRMVLAVVMTASLFIICNLWDLRETTIYYEEGNKIPNNPDRGFYVQIDSSDKDRIEKYSTKVRFILLAYDLYEYREQQIPEEKLIELEDFLEEAKNRNVKCIFRAAYGFDPYEQNDADSLERIQMHIHQMAPILNQYKEQIYCVQAGFFGPWGEWHSSRYLEEEENAKKNRNWLLRELCDQLDEKIVINVRRPRFIRDALVAGIDRTRLGYHDDGMFGSESDLGTYDDPSYDREEEMIWLQENLKTGKNGGEMPKANEYSNAERVNQEFSKMKISYLNLKYNEEVYEQWKQEKIQGMNAYEYIVHHLGYRFQIEEISYPISFRKSLFSNYKKIRIVLKNEGYAPISDEYQLEWMVKDQKGQIYTFLADEKISEIHAGESMEIVLPFSFLKEISIDRLGIRISRESDEKKQKEQCVELANDQIEYVSGVNVLQLE